MDGPSLCSNTHSSSLSGSLFCRLILPLLLDSHSEKTPPLSGVRRCGILILIHNTGSKYIIQRLKLLIYKYNILTYNELDHSLPGCLPACRYQLTSNTITTARMERRLSRLFEQVLFTSRAHAPTPHASPRIGNSAMWDWLRAWSGRSRSRKCGVGIRSGFSRGIAVQHGTGCKMYPNL
jgi:hypothetical protein